MLGPPISQANAKNPPERLGALIAYVFAGNQGFVLLNVKHTSTTVTKAAGLSDVRMSDLCHTFASLLVSQGQCLQMIGAMLGYTQAQTTARYAHLFDDPLMNAAELVGAAVPSRAQP